MSQSFQGKLRLLSVEGFRGALRSVNLDFGDECKSMVVYGDNGTGKSTFADAVERFFTERIEHLAREGCQDSAYRHRRLPDIQEAIVSVTFDDPGYHGTRLLNGKLELAFQCTDDVRAYILKASRDTFILRHAQMRDFVDKTKTDKLKYVADILGLGDLTNQRDQIASVSRQLRNDPQYKTLERSVKDYRKQLGVKVKDKRSDLTQTLATCEQLRQKLGGPIPISHAASLSECTEALLKLRGQDERTKLALQLRDQQSRLKALPELMSICDEMEKLGQEILALQADKRAVDEIALAGLYRAGQQVLARNLGEADSCPLCGQTVDIDHLSHTLADQLEAISAIQSRLKRLDEQRNSLRRHLDQWQVWAAKLSATTWDECVTSASELKLKAAEVSALATSWATDLDSTNDSLRSVFTVFAEQRSLADALLQQCKLADGHLQERLTKIEESAEEKERNQQLESLRQTNTAVQALIQAERQTEAFDRQINTMEAVTKCFEAMEKAVLEQVLSAISDDVNRYYLALHPNEGFDHVRLSPTASRGIEFEFEYHGESISPPGQLLSESHLNTLGICLFLATARHFNKSLRFLILDDIVNSVDAGHRQMMARLLRDEFGDIQLLLLTHDEIWFDVVKRLTTDVWRASKITGWDYHEGFWMNDAFPDLGAEARHLLISGEVDSAGNKARKWFEYRLKQLCYELGVEFPFKFNDKNESRMVSELLPKLKSHLKNSQTFAANRTIFNDLEANQYVGNLLSHNSSVVSSPPKAADVRLMLNDLARLEALVTCPTCGKIVKRGASCRCTPPFSWN